jgi:acyl-CoA thioester hydrolase
VNATVIERKGTVPGDWKKITMADLEMLSVGHRQLIPEDYLDANNHMNVMWYTHLFSCGLGDTFRRVGLTTEYFRQCHATTFALEGHVRYFNEVRVAQQVTIRTRVIGRSDKRFHIVHFMSNDDLGKLAATMEAIGTHVDFEARRSAPFPPHIAAAFDRLLAEHSQLPWPAPLCGAMHV